MLKEGGPEVMVLKRLHFHTIEMKVLQILLFHTKSPELGAFSSVGPVMVDFVHNCSEQGV